MTGCPDGGLRHAAGECPWCDQERFDRHIQAKAERPLGTCPRGTPGCKYADCSPAFGKSCYGGNAPRHVDMGTL